MMMMSTAHGTHFPVPSSSPTSKTITLIRHGVALHNICDEKTGAKPNLYDPKYTDSPLTRRGELQAIQLGERLKKLGMVRSYHDVETTTDGVTREDTCSSGKLSNDDDGSIMNGDAMDVDIVSHNNQQSTEASSTIDLVVCSPLSRCLQTASHIFPSYFMNSHPKSVTASTMERQVGVYVLDRNCKVCCHGDVREAHGKNYSDKRSPLSQLKEKFPTVQYHPSVTENDTDWQSNTRETWQDVSRRVHNFFLWLMQQPHNNIAIVTHGVWMECALSNYCPAVLQFGKKRVYNCDVYSGKLLGSSDGNIIMMKDVKQITFDDQ